MEQEPGQRSSLPEYWIEDWLTDLGFYFSTQLRLKGQPQFDASLARELDEFFAAKYGATASFHQRRLSAAAKYWNRHGASFDEGAIGIVTKSSGYLGMPTAMALWAMYSGCPEDSIDEDFPVNVMLDFAREAERELDRRKKK
jgi:hypothetical protein